MRNFIRTNEPCTCVITLRIAAWDSVNQGRHSCENVMCVANSNPPSCCATAQGQRANQPVLVGGVKPCAAVPLGLLQRSKKTVVVDHSIQQPVLHVGITRRRAHINCPRKIQMAMLQKSICCLLLRTSPCVHLTHNLLVAVIMDSWYQYNLTSEEHAPFCNGPPPPAPQQSTSRDWACSKYKCIS